MKNIKSLLTETVLVCETVVFWMVALPAAAVIFPAMALWEQIGRLATLDHPASPVPCHP